MNDALLNVGEWWHSSFLTKNILISHHLWNTFYAKQLAVSIELYSSCSRAFFWSILILGFKTQGLPETGLPAVLFIAVYKSVYNTAMTLLYALDGAVMTECVCVAFAGQGLLVPGLGAGSARRLPHALGGPDSAPQQREDGGGAPSQRCCHRRRRRQHRTQDDGRLGSGAQVSSAVGGGRPF